ncbi:pitrilysin family metalloprotease NDAI_0H01660 [Naumovozyma dairenensis CBS 421]|uniref:Presequence protease, mitochondrial n=1 Tax=Naumovozyma dairenensis (strain ATCC 10597 / BCRC 20456 / CBS 421 / NBRC 0211 / NRRL Y-12639) TaxID=1071378 RepID=G0WEX9_NAUDC|nr:hypothetical protein NDAI_0H01660 [Naumovozyma dairenensis CBS 421]CCD26340.1 hypothetical protein NDAI_0H01660 [Naumovozyma dairenensis CBS 421]
MLRFQRFASGYAQASILRKYPVGGIIHGYEIKRAVPVPELKLTAVDLIHNQTGAKHLHIDRDDKNNVFSISFKTNPPNCTGVPHVLEHTTLCGSLKYPVRDPFFKMLNRSLANFMNAMTGHDYTFFPFSTTNAKDFENLRNVYLDATLNPLLKAEDFYQEGWRLENTDVNDPKSDLTFKGVVYNEMKGQVSNPNYYFWTKFQESIYPSLNNSGGDPTKITDLKYEDLLEFHHKNYHPSNSRTYTYGNLPLNDTLKSLHERFIGYGKRVQSANVATPQPLSNNRDIIMDGQFDFMLPPEIQLKTSMTWMCGSPDDYYETFLLKILGNLLLDGHSSKFYQRLIESNIGLDFSVNTGVESTTALNFFTVGVQGAKDLDLFKKTVLQTFESILNEDFDRKKIDAIIHQLELGKKDQKSDFGMQILYSIIPGWTNNLDPLNSLMVDELLARFREDLKKNGDKIFKNLLNKYIIGKPYHQFSMEGKEDFSNNLELEEEERLRSKVETLDAEDKDIIFKRGQALQTMQQKKEDVSCLPTLTIDDIPRNGDSYEVQKDATINYRLTDTNDITYIRAKRSLNDSIPLELYPYLPLFAESLTTLGTTTETYSDIEDSMRLYTGGVSANINVSSNPITLQPHLSFAFDGWALNSKANHIFDIWKKLLIETDFQKNSAKMKTLIKSLSSSNTSSVADSGHLYARGYASAGLNTTSAINETLSGIKQIQLISKLATYIDDEGLFQREVIDKMNLLKLYIINSRGLDFFVTTDTSVQNEEMKKEIQKFTAVLPSHPVRKFDKTSDCNLLPRADGVPTLITFPFQVHYTAQCLTGVPYTHEDGAPLQVLSNLLTFRHLHREVREKGGAYGGGATYSALPGIFSYYSYRDPQPLRSLDIFNKSAEYVLNGSKWVKNDLDEAKLTIFQQIDAPTSPKGEGITEFFSGVTDEMRQKRREQLLDVSLSDINRVAEKYLLSKNSSVAVVGPLIDGETVEPAWNIKTL